MIMKGTPVGELAAVQAAFGFLKTRPTPRPLVFTDADGTGARLATDAGIAAVVQRVVGNVVVRDHRPDVFLGPIRQRADFYQLKLVVPADDRRLGTIGTLVATDRAGPGVPALRGPVQDFQL